MTKAKISQYDAVAANNTDVNGVNIAENCPPSGMNNMGREIMAALKRFQTGSDSDGVTVGGNLVVSGTSTLSTTSISSADINAVTLDAGTANGVAYLNGSKVLTTGSALTFDGTDVGIGGAPVTGLPLRLLRTSSGAQIRYQNTAATWDSGVTAAGAYEIFSAANTSIQFGVNSSEQMRLTSTGLGIGTSSPGVRLHVADGDARISQSGTGNIGLNILRSAGTTANWFNYIPSGSSDLRWFLGNDLMTLTASGNLGLGVTPSAWGSYKAVQLPGASFAGFSDGAGNNQAVIAANAFYNNVNWIYRASDEASKYRQLDGQHQFFTAPSGTAGDAISFTQAMTLDASGNLLIGYTSSNGSYKLQVNSQIFATNATIATSDGRYKENIQTLDGALSLVSQLNPVQFSWKEHPVHNFDCSGPTIGFIAQEVEQVLVDKPYLNSIIKRNECVIEPEEKDAEGNITKEAVTEEFLGIAEGNMIALLTKALQELKADFDAYKASHP